ncbi:MAG: c-type cytochrome [Vicinamibacterales bacterium]
MTRLCAGRTLCLAGAAALVLAGSASAQTERLEPGIAEGPAITVLTGLRVPQFETEMRHFVQALGVNCGGCHTRGNFASEANPRKAAARRMIEMTKALNQRYFGAYTPMEGDSTLGRVTCYTCHRGELSPKAGPAPPAR